ncbi:MAG: DUF4145 domain-containing protein [Rhizobiaceae bacterium]|nr:DUF4145 domain-containing protein [Rhizobiaceae bacterium]
MEKFSPPMLGATAFHCPTCGAYSHHHWFEGRAVSVDSQSPFHVEEFRLSRCCHCSKPAYWLFEKLVFPGSYGAPPPNQDLRQDIRDVYVEAAAIAQSSPRGAAALLRLGVQLLCIQLGEKGKNINTDIKSLVAKGLPIEIQQALDVVRVIGNNAVHPGAIVVDDEADTVTALFWLVNAIAERMITEPKKIADLHEKLPETVRAAIAARDGNKVSSPRK